MIQKIKIGTLVEDRGALGIITDFYPKGTTKGDAKGINWRDNYKIQYANNNSYVIGARALERLMASGQIKIIQLPAGPEDSV